MVTLTEKQHFNKVYNSNKKWHTAYFVLFFKDSETKRVGFSVSKKVGNAVCRNLIKRRLRSLYRQSESNTINGDMILLAKQGIDKASYNVLQSQYLHALSKLKLVRK